MFAAFLAFLALAASHRKWQRLQALPGNRLATIQAESVIAAFESFQCPVDLTKFLGGQFGQGDVELLLQLRDRGVANVHSVDSSGILIAVGTNLAEPQDQASSKSLSAALEVLFQLSISFIGHDLGSEETPVRLLR